MEKNGIGWNRLEKDWEEWKKMDKKKMDGQVESRDEDGKG